MNSRFGFGRNWKKYSKLITKERLNKAELHLKDRFQTESFEGNFLDIGCGSGVFSVAALNLGAHVRGFDFDVHSVETSRRVLTEFSGTHQNWEIRQGDILSGNHIDEIAKSDYVYSWGVLHHTGNMSLAIENIAKNCKKDTKWVVAIYNDLGKESVNWTKLKKLYVNYRILRPILLMYSYYRFWAKQQLRLAFQLENPFKTWREYTIDSRGMSAWYDLIDWAGGYPFEVATPDWMIQKVVPLGWKIEKIWRNESVGNNEFLFIKIE
jgi:2-polyprenyl-3-methyl-5-hydroxy-6-metoxy-1,4-benzoquinol methylase